MVKRRALKAGLSGRVCNHTFRATDITAYLGARGTIEKAQQLAAHESPKTMRPEAYPNFLPAGLLPRGELPQVINSESLLDASDSPNHRLEPIVAE